MIQNRDNSIEISKEEFQKIGYQLIDRIAELIDSIDKNPVTTTKSLADLTTSRKKWL